MHRSVDCHVVAIVLCVVVSYTHAQCGTGSVPYGIKYADGSVNVLCGTFDCYNNGKWGRAVGSLMCVLASLVVCSHATVRFLHRAALLTSGSAARVVRAASAFELMLNMRMKAIRLELTCCTYGGMVPRYATFEDTVARDGDTIKGGEVYDASGAVVGVLYAFIAGMLYCSARRR